MNSIYLYLYFLIGIVQAPIVFGHEHAFWQRRYPAIAWEYKNQDWNAAIVCAIVSIFFWPGYWIARIVFCHVYKIVPFWQYGLKFKRDTVPGPETSIIILEKYNHDTKNADR